MSRQPPWLHSGKGSSRSNTRLACLALRLPTGGAHPGMTPAIMGGPTAAIAVWIAAAVGSWTGPASRRQHLLRAQTEPACLTPGQEAWWVHASVQQQQQQQPWFACITVQPAHGPPAEPPEQTDVHLPAPPPRPPHLHPRCLQLASGSGGSSGTQRLTSAASFDSLRQRLSSPNARSLPLDGQLTTSTIADVAATDLSKLPEGFNDVSPADFELIKAIGEGSFGQVRQTCSGPAAAAGTTFRTSAKVQHTTHNTQHTTHNTQHTTHTMRGWTGTCRLPTPPVNQPPAPTCCHLLSNPLHAGVAGQVLPDHRGSEDADPGQRPQRQLNHAAADGTTQPVPRGGHDV